MNRLLTVALGMLWCFLGSLSAAALPGKLVAGVSGEHPLAAGETHEYVVPLRAGDYLAVDLEERGVDITLRILDPQGLSLAEQQTTYGRNDIDRVWIIAQHAGRFRLQLVTNSPGGGKYFIHTLAIRPATGSDRNAVAASDAFHAGQRAADGKTPQEMRTALQ